MKSIIALLFLLVISSTYTWAQDDSLHISEFNSVKDTIQPLVVDIQTMTKNTEEGVVIRWAPSNVVTWQMGNIFGYSVDKLSLSDTTASWVPLKSSNIKPWPLDDWQHIVNEERPYAAIAAMTIHGEEKEQSKGFADRLNQLENRYGFALLAAEFDAETATASGLRYVHPRNSADSICMYRIYTFDPDRMQSSDTAYQIVHWDTLSQMHAPEVYDPIEGDKAITLRWFGGIFDVPYSAYWIERSEDGQHYERIHDRPFMSAISEIRKDNHVVSYIDSVANNYQKYYYRIKGIDPFADISPASEVIEAMGRDRTPEAAPDQVEVVSHSSQLELIWEYDSGIDIEGFRVYRSIGNVELFLPYSDLLPRDTRSFIDEKPDPRETSYYYVTSVDAEGNEGKSSVVFGFTNDAEPPAPPTELRAEVDTTGMVLLQWEAPLDKDIRGYQVLFANSDQIPFAAVVGPLRDSTYYVDRVQLHTLTEDIYYRVIAVDWSYNQSEPSEIYRLQKPDLVPPAPSVFADYQVSDSGIAFDWIASKSKDVVSITLERKTIDNHWVALANFDSSKGSYIDTKVNEGQLYHYRLATMDDAGNTTYNKQPLVLEALKSFYIESVASITARATDTGVELLWEHNAEPESKFMIYRKSTDGAFKTLKQIASTDTYIDATAISNTEYTYAIKVLAADGRESQLIYTDPVKR